MRLDSAANAVASRTLRAFSHHRQSILALGVRGASLVAAFCITYFIGHDLGPAANGQYALITQTAIFVSVLGLLGLDIAVVRHFSGARASAAPLKRAIYLKTAALSIGLMVALALLLAAAGDLLWKPLFGDVVSHDALLVASVLLIGRGGTRLFGAILRSQHAFVTGQSLDVLAIPLVVAVLLFLGLLQDLDSILWATAAASIAATTVAFAIGLRFAQGGPDAFAPTLPKLFKSALPLWGASISANIGDWFGLAVAAAILGAYDTGLFRVAAQAAAVMQVVSMALFSVYSPKISTAFHAGDLAWVGRLTRSATRLSAVCAIPMAAGLLIFAEPLLGLIAPEFEQASTVLRILVLGQLGFTLTGPCGITLAMSGNERTNLVLMIVSTSMLFIFVPIATAHWGLTGLAVCMSVVLMARNLLTVILVDRLLGLNVLSGRVRARHSKPTDGSN